MGRKVDNRTTRLRRCKLEQQTCLVSFTPPSPFLFMKKSSKQAPAISLRACLAEFIGTFLLAAGVAESIGMMDVGIPTPVVAGLILGTLVYTIGSISGAHINPAVTLSLWTVGKIKGNQAAGYILAQLLGGILAFNLQKQMFGVNLDYGDINMVVVALFEMLGAFILVWGISSVVHGKVDPAAAGLTIGASLTIGAMIGSMGSFGILNPAVSIGLGVFSPVSLLAPIVGGVIAAHLYRWIIQVK